MEDKMEDKMEKTNFDFSTNVQGFKDLLGKKWQPGNFRHGFIRIQQAQVTAENIAFIEKSNSAFGTKFHKDNSLDVGDIIKINAEKTHVPEKRFVGDINSFIVFSSKSGWSQNKKMAARTANALGAYGYMLDVYGNAGKIDKWKPMQFDTRNGELYLVSKIDCENPVYRDAEALFMKETAILINGKAQELRQKNVSARFSEYDRSASLEIEIATDMNEAVFTSLQDKLVNIIKENAIMTDKQLQQKYEQLNYWNDKVTI